MSVAYHLEPLDLVLRDEVFSRAADAVATCRSGRLKEGFASLRMVESQGSFVEDLPGTFFVYLGLGAALFEEDYQKAVPLCELGITLAPTQAEGYVSLARVHNKFGDRKLALDAIRDGLRASLCNAELVAFRTQMGIRRPPVIPRLPRDHRLNRILGLWRHRLRTRFGG